MGGTGTVFVARPRSRSRTAAALIVCLLAVAAPGAGGVLAADPHRVLIIQSFIPMDTTFTKAAVAPDKTVSATGSTSQVVVSSTDDANSSFWATFTAPTGADL